MDDNRNQPAPPTGHIMELSNRDFEPVARVLAATVIAQTLSYSLRREYLEGSEVLGNTNPVQLRLRERGGNLSDISWARVDQVGRPPNDDLRGCMVALERILHATHVPGRHQLVFLVTGDRKVNRMFLGLRPLHFRSGYDCASSMDVLSDFGASNWPGLRLTACNDKGVGHEIVPDLFKRKHCGIVSLTGLPAVRKDNFSTYPATMDRLMGALRGKKWAYLVVADPVRTAEVNDIVSVCRDLAGRADAMKEFSFSESTQTGQSKAFSEAKSQFENWSRNHGSTAKDWYAKNGFIGGAIGVGGLIATGALLASVLVPGAAALIGPVSTVGSGLMMGLGLAVNALVPGKTTGEGEVHGQGTQEGYTKTYSDSQSLSLSRSFVNKHMEAVAETLTHHITRFEQSLALGCWQVGAYVIAEDDMDSQSCGQLLRSLVSGQDSYYEPIRLHQISGLGRHELAKSLKFYESPQIQILGSNGTEALPHPLGPHFQQLGTLMNTEELAMLVNMPTRSVPGINVIEVPEEGSQRARALGPGTIRMGHLLYSGTATDIPYPLEVNQLAKHTLVCGINGSGKSTTCRRILQELLAHRSKVHPHGIPFLVIEPAKDEYVEWAMAMNEVRPGSINVFMPGRKAWGNYQLGEFFLNPFDIVWLDENAEPRVLEHIDRLKTILIASLPMQEVLPVLMEELVYRVYMTALKVGTSPNDSPDGAQMRHFKWLPTDPEKDRLALPDMRRPTFTQLRHHIPLVIAEKGYDVRISNDLRAALTTRVDSFRRGWRGSVLNQEKPNPGFWGTLFDKPTIVNLSALTSDDDKAFFMAVLLTFLYEYRQSRHELEHRSLLQTPDLQHLVVIEEAHRILCNASHYSPFAANPKAKLAEMFSHMISEVRAYGQGILIADQVPARLNPDAVKNTNLKIAHRLVASDDREMMAVCMDLKPSHTRLLGQLTVGQALIRGEMENEAAWIKVERSVVS